MPELNLEEFPEDQRSAIRAEIDRRVTSAVQTTTKKVTEQVSAELSEKMQKDYEAKMQQAIADAQAQATMTEEQKIQALSQQLEEQKKAFERTQLEIKAQSKLLDAGLDKNAVEQLVPLIVAGADATTIDTHLNTFVATQQAAVEAALQKQKEALASNVTPPASVGGAIKPQDPDAVVSNILQDQNLDPRFAQASGVQVLLDAAIGDNAGL